MEELRKLVKELEQLTDKKEIVAKLQEIGAELINKYEIKVGNVTIEPLLVEAYYYDKDKFPDDSAHAAKESKANTYELARDRQKNHFGELYVHYGTKDGIDVVLSDGEYYLSYLIKNALINENFASQCKISEKLCSSCDRYNSCLGNDKNKGFGCKHYGENILVKVNPKEYEIAYAKRKGLKNATANLRLSALPIKPKEKIMDYPITAGQSRTEIIREYIENQIKKGGYNEDELRNLAKGLIRWDKFKK